MNQQIHTDIIIIGGGIAGLWLLNRLRARGYQAILLEREHLGCGQTGASQGMIHGGMKYALGGALTGASEAIAAMPQRWRDCLAGKGPLDLSDVAVLSDHYYLWSTASAPSRLAAFLGSQLLRGRTDAVARADLPPLFRTREFRGAVYRLHDLVLDTHSLIASLHRRHREHMIRAFPSGPQPFTLDASGSIAALTLDGDVTLTAQRFIFAAGAGNEGLLQLCGQGAPAMQRRPLHQVLVRHRYPHALHAHSIDLLSGSKPRITVTTHPAGDGSSIWYLGGALAESGVDRTESEQIAHAKAELHATLPWVELPDASWRTLRIDRAEPAQAEHARPDRHFVRAVGNAIVVWPVKLTLTPALSEEVEDLLLQQGVRPTGGAGGPQLPASMARATPAPPFWTPCFA